MEISFDLPISHSQHHNNVQDGEYGKGITEGTMDHVPQIKHLLRSGEKQYAFGQRRLQPRHSNRAFQLGIVRRQNSEQRDRATLRNLQRAGAARKLEMAA